MYYRSHETFFNKIRLVYVIKLKCCCDVHACLQHIFQDKKILPRFFVKYCISSRSN